MSEKDDFDLRIFLPYLLNQAAEEASLSFQQVYKSRYGMLRTEWRVLFHLGIYGELTAKEIGTRAKMHKTKISRAVQKLAERRFLMRVRDATDRRSEKLSLTPQGRAAYEDLRTVAARHDAALTGRFSAADVERLREMLVALAEPSQASKG
ncbi:MarR family winged helix-turn-helix transcriptional regulator [Aestuariivita boseongensis]|uniref:MarR family winged helix-turn-helix transcriptional regulator n=1 Tax=Aestuariivita boseongensis TaxID=1470562 RepID=UPI0006821ED1|nr:MarR family transcriptional regulator [Aestuariivita boseongensis]